MIKLLMSWDIRPGKEADYMEFITEEFAPGMARLGIQPTEAWYTVAGNGPQVLSGGVIEDQETLMNILRGKEWRELEKKLLAYVINYKYKIIPASGSFQL
jgi:hypothetical protein